MLRSTKYVLRHHTATRLLRVLLFSMCVFAQNVALAQRREHIKGAVLRTYHTSVCTRIFVIFSRLFSIISLRAGAFPQNAKYVDTGRPSGTCGRGLSSIRALQLAWRALKVFFPAGVDTVHYGVDHTSLGRFSMLDISTAGIVSVPKSRRCKRFVESFFRRRVVRYVTLVAPSWLSSNRAWKTASRGCDM